MSDGGKPKKDEGSPSDRLKKAEAAIARAEFDAEQDAKVATLEAEHDAAKEAQAAAERSHAALTKQRSQNKIEEELATALTQVAEHRTELGRSEADRDRLQTELEAVIAADTAMADAAKRTQEALNALNKGTAEKAVAEAEYKPS